MMMLLLVACTAPQAPSSAKPLQQFTTSLPDDLEDQTWLVLQQDAFRREARFIDAVEPGYLFAATRVHQDELEAKRFTNEEIYQLGAQLFDITFTPEVGFGAADLPPLARFHTGRRGGPDAYRCGTCHWRGGPAGAGDGADNAYLDGDGDTEAAGLARNPRSLVGAGVIELLAQERSAELATQRDALVAAAKQAGTPLRRDLSAGGISFGWLGALPDGSLDTQGLVGVDPDLVIKPFGWKGTFANLRDAVEDELLIHHGMQSSWLTAHAGPERIGSKGGADPDGDGVTDEITEGQLSALTLYLAMQEIPQIDMPQSQDQLAQWSVGRRRFDEIGCAGCHTPSIRLKSPVYTLPSRDGGPALRVDLSTDGGEPRLGPSADGWEIYLFSDLRRHDMGPALSEPRPDRGVASSLFMTPPLWGMARARPYLHDGRAATAEEAVLAHGGEAQAARDAYAALPAEDRYAIRLFLATLTRATRMVSP